MGFLESLVGRVKCRVVSASLVSTIGRISACCEIMNLENLDDLTATFWVNKDDFPLVFGIDNSIKIVSRSGLYWMIMPLKKRPVLVLGILVILFFILYLPTRILFIDIQGNNAVSTGRILDSAENCGIHFGASRRHVRSEEVKNSLLEAIPQLQWACVNTKGCVARITVQERSAYNTNSVRSHSNIIAGKDGVITEITALRGDVQCRVGQAVKEGQLLVSGILDLGLVLKAVGAEAEIRAETERSVTAIALTDSISKDHLNKRTGSYSLLIGKKLIKFSKDSGISPSGCGRINKIYQLTLPGGFQLPISVIHQRTLYYNTADDSVADTASFQWLRDTTDRVVMDQMVAGEIINRTAKIQTGEGYCYVTAQYRCTEMIAIAQKKETNVTHGTRD